MANIKANIKNIRKTQKRHSRNKAEITTYRSKAKITRQSQDVKDLAQAYKKIDSICAKGKIHKNKANRLKARLAKNINKKNVQKTQ